MPYDDRSQKAQNQYSNNTFLISELNLPTMKHGNTEPLKMPRNGPTETEPLKIPRNGTTENTKQRN